ncbi:hypothetical protein DL96DRAFT_1666139 [Flagelloscypha sp. PMI_526]|nr:hypothetical protein DL96DRAFT_1666139 [Flagelloscypha sp. PMI_526]
MDQSPGHKSSRNHSTDTMRTRLSRESASYEKGDRKERRRSRSRDRGSERSYRDRSRERERHRHRDRSYDRHRDRRHREDRDREDRRRKRDDSEGRDEKPKRRREDDGASPRHRSRSRDKYRSRRDERSPRYGRDSRRKMDSPPPPAARSPVLEGPPADDHTYNPDEPKEDDSEQRSVFVSQLAARLTARDLGYFFEDKLGDNTVMDSRIVTDRLSRRSKGIGYVEFRTVDLVEKALNLSGTVVMGLPIMVQLTESERNKLHAGDMLYVGSLHFNLTEDDIRQVFEPFGELEYVDLHRDPVTNRSKGYAFVQYRRSEDAKMALEQMEGFELAGRTLRVNTVHEKGNIRYTQSESLDDTAGGNLNAASRQALMQKLARTEQTSLDDEPIARPQIAAMQSRSVLLRNMFDPAEESGDEWDKELAEDVKGECTISYWPNSQGEIYVKFESVDSAKKAIDGLNGRYFGGKQVSASFISDAIMQAHQ